MTSYVGKPRHPVPARNYDIFQSAFEKKVAEAQKKIRDIESMQLPYIVATEVAKASQLPMDIKVSLDPGSVIVTIHVGREHWLGDVDEFVADLGLALVHRDLHETGDPSDNGDVTTYGMKSWTFRVGNMKQHRLSVYAHISMQGTRDFELKVTSMMTEIHTYRLVPRVEEAEVVVVDRTESNNFYDRMSKELGLPREVIKTMVAMLAYSADFPSVLTKVGRSVNQRNLNKVQTLSDELAASAEKFCDNVMGIHIKDGST